MEPARRSKPFLVQRSAMMRGALLVVVLLALSLGGALVAGWEVRVLRSSALEAQGELLLAAHRNSVQLVSRTLALQSELDAQEDHDRAVLQLYLQLERERLPQLLQELTVATAGCDAESQQRVSDAANRLRREMHAHSTQMLDKLSKDAGRFRSRSKELAAEVSTLARADRQRLRSADRQLRWSDAELDAPLNALLRSLRRPNATFPLPPEVLHEWERAAELVQREGGANNDGVRTTLLRLANTAPVRQEAVKRLKGAGADMGAAFVGLLQRARLHHRTRQTVASVALPRLIGHQRQTTARGANHRTRCHGWPPEAHETASEGSGLPSALGKRRPPPNIPQNGRGPGAGARPRRHLRRV